MRFSLCDWTVRQIGCRAVDLRLGCKALARRHRGTRREVERLICGLAAGPLPAHHRGTRCKYVLVSSYAASMPRKVPRRWAGKDQSRTSVCMAFIKEATDQPSGAVSSPLAGPCGGMDAATEPPGTGSRRVPRAARAPHPRPQRSGEVRFPPWMQQRLPGPEQSRQACGDA